MLFSKQKQKQNKMTVTIVMMIAMFALSANGIVYVLLAETNTQMNVTVGGSFDTGSVWKVTPSGGFSSFGPLFVPSIGELYAGFDVQQWEVYCGYPQALSGPSSWSANTARFAPSSGPYL